MHLTCCRFAPEFAGVLSSAAGISPATKQLWLCLLRLVFAAGVGWHCAGADDPEARAPLDWQAGGLAGQGACVESLVRCRRYSSAV